MTAPRTIGDTPLGQWLQKFSSSADDGRIRQTNIRDDIITDGSHFNANGTLRANVVPNRRGRIVEIIAEDLRQKNRTE